jgi:signal transduction histidine kinase
MKRILVTILKNRPLAIVVTGFLLTIATFIGNIVLTYEIASNLRIKVSSIGKIYGELDLMNAIKSDLGYAESSMKNYIISGQTIYLRSHLRAVERLDEHMDQLKAGEQELKISRELFTALQEAIKERKKLFFATMKLVKSRNPNGVNEALDLFSDGAGKAPDIREILNNMETGLRVSLQINQKYIDRSISYGGYTNYLAIGIAVLVAFFATLSIAQDYLRQKEIEKILRQLNEDKTRLFSILGHDLRLPLSGINAVIYLLKNHLNALSEAELKESISLLDQAAVNYSNLLEDLLTWSRLQMDKIQTNPQPWNIPELTQEVASLFGESLHQKKISLSNEIPAELVLTVDRPMFLTVFRNLISNAIKFTRSGGNIVLSYRKEKDWDTLAVSDNGTGMSPALMKTLFTPSSISMAGTDNEAGTGLGLSICKEFLSKEDCLIRVESEEGKGSVFTIMIPSVVKSGKAVPAKMS